MRHQKPHPGRVAVEKADPVGAGQPRDLERQGHGHLSGSGPHHNHGHHRQHRGDCEAEGAPARGEARARCQPARRLFASHTSLCHGDRRGARADRRKLVDWAPSHRLGKAGQRERSCAHTPSPRGLVSSPSDHAHLMHGVCWWIHGAGSTRIHAPMYLSDFFAAPPATNSSDTPWSPKPLSRLKRQSDLNWVRFVSGRDPQGCP